MYNVQRRFVIRGWNQVFLSLVLEFILTSNVFGYFKLVTFFVDLFSWTRIAHGMGPCWLACSL